jgi:hypothetical protein
MCISEDEEEKEGDGDMYLVLQLTTPPQDGDMSLTALDMSITASITG